MPAELVDLATIAEALGVTYTTARNKMATSPHWPPHHDRAGLGGAKRWRVVDLPTAFPRRNTTLDVRAAVQRHLAAQAVAGLTPALSQGESKKSPAPSGEPLPAGLPSPADPSPPASGAGGLTPGGAGVAFGPPAGLLPAPAAPALPSFAEGVALIGAVLSATDAAAKANAEVAHRRYEILRPILDRRIVGRAALEAHAASHGTTATTVYRWLKQYRQGGIAALADRPRSDAGTARVLVGEVWETAARGAGIKKAKRAEIAQRMVQVVGGLWAQTTTPSWTQVAHLARPELVRLSIEAGMPEDVARKACVLPRRFVEGEKRFNLIALAERDAKGFYDRVVTSIHRSRRQLMPGEVVFGDVSPADIPVLRDDGSMGWARLIAWRDAATNMWHITGYLANPGAGVRREHVALSFAQMCAEAPWGMPRRLYLDNGSEYSWTEMLEAWAGLARFTGGVFGGAFGGAHGADGLGEDGRIWRTEPFKPRAKLIEGGFSNLLNYMGWNPHFAGSDRLTKKTRALGRAVQPTTLAELKTFIGQAIQYYHGVPQSGFLAGLSPVEKLHDCLDRGFKRVTVDADALALAFSEVAERRVRAGQIEFGGWYYHHPDLYAHQGEQLTVRWARHAPDAAYVFHPRTRQFLCAALPAPVFQFADPEGAKHAARLAKEARQAVSVMKGQVAWLEPRDLMGEFAKLAGVAQAIERSAEGERRIQVSDDARAMLEARNAAVLAAIGRADATVERERLLRSRAEEADEEEALAREMFG